MGVLNVDGKLHWYALMVRARQEKAAAADLSKRGFEVFLPTRFERRAWSDRIQRVELAVFPGYLFVRATATPASRVAALRARGVVGFVGTWQAVPDACVDSLRLVLGAERDVDPVQKLVPGLPVRVGQGPLRGVVGVVEEGVDGRRRIVVNVELLGRAVRAVLLADDVLEGASALAA